MGDFTLFGLRIDGDVQIGPKRRKGTDDGEGRVPLPDVEIESAGPSKAAYGAAGLVGLLFLVVLGVLAKRKLGGDDDDEVDGVVTTDPFDERTVPDRR